MKKKIPILFIGLLIMISVVKADTFISLRLQNNSLNSRGFQYHTDWTINGEKAILEEDYQLENFLSYGFEIGRDIHLNRFLLTLGFSFEFFMAEETGYFNTSIPHPLNKSVYRNLEGEIPNLKLKGSVYTLFLLIKTVELGFYRNQIGLEVGIQSGVLYLLESVTVGESITNGELTPVVNNMDKRAYKFSEPLYGVRLDNMFKISQSFHLLINFRYTFHSKIIFENARGDDLEIGTERFMVGLGLGVHF